MKKILRITTLLAIVFLIARGSVTLLLPTPAILTVFSVGQGESVLYRDSSGRTLLFDGGPDDSVLSQLGKTLAPWERHIDIMALSHAHSDHVDGLIHVLNRYSIGEVWETGAQYEGEDIQTWRKLIAEKNIPIKKPNLSSIYSFGESTISVIHPLKSFDNTPVKNAHDATLVLRIVHGQESILLTGDLNEEHETNLIDSCKPPSCTLASTILQIPHHGSASGLSPPFLAAIHPQLAFICVGIGNKFHHPREEILQRLHEATIPYHRTDTEGGLTIIIWNDRIEYKKNDFVPR